MVAPATGKDQIHRYSNNNTEVISIRKYTLKNVVLSVFSEKLRGWSLGTTGETVPCTSWNGHLKLSLICPHLSSQPLSSRSQAWETDLRSRISWLPPCESALLSSALPSGPSSVTTVPSPSLVFAPGKLPGHWFHGARRCDFRLPG